MIYGHRSVKNQIKLGKYIHKNRAFVPHVISRMGAF